ncbi:hypothetical protein HG530_008694 [Fusarium avenaceum]|nr:hypothetical protein HG530_008694 [Fusarium avenaceum]
MSRDVETQRSTIAHEVGGTLTNLDVVDGVVNRVAATGGQPELGGCVSVSKDQRGETRHGVLRVRNAIFSAGLVRDESRKLCISYSRRAVGVDVHGCTADSKVRGSKCGHSTAQGVTCGNNLEGRVRLEGFRYSSGCLPRDLGPGVLEARVYTAAGGETAVVLVKVEVCKPVADVAAATERDDDFFAGTVCRDVAADASLGATVKPCKWKSGVLVEGETYMKDATTVTPLD